MNIKRISRLFAIPLLMLCFQSTQAQPIMIPGFMGIESSYMDAPAAGSDASNAYFTISNLYSEPIVLLSATGDIFENATFLGPNNDELEQLIIQPGERLVMGPDTVYMHLSDLQTSSIEDHSQQITLLVRRGLEAEEEVEAQDGFGGLSGARQREAGIPNEKEYVVNVDLKY